MTRIQPTLALAIAGMVGAGLTPGDGEKERAQSSLMAIGLMILNATDRDEIIQATLDMADRSHVTISKDGMSISYTPNGK